MKPQPLRVLLAEDDENLTEMIQLAFEGHEFELDVARYSLEAVRKAAVNHPHLILMDVVMPSMDGYEAARRIRSENETKNIPIFFLTAKSLEQDIDRGKKSGGERYLVKPFSPFELIDLIEDYFQCHPQIST